MDLSEYAGIQAQLADHEARLRAAETFTSPVQAQINRRLDETVRSVSGLETQGAAQKIIVTEMREDLGDIKDDIKSARVTIRSALITAAASIAVQVILFFVLRAA